MFKTKGSFLGVLHPTPSFRKGAEAPTRPFHGTALGALLSISRSGVTASPAPLAQTYLRRVLGAITFGLLPLSALFIQDPSATRNLFCAGARRDARARSPLCTKDITLREFPSTSRAPYWDGVHGRAASFY